jgi:hypothetical protein
MARKLENAKPLVKTHCPESFIFYNTNFHRVGPQYSLSKQYEINKDNMVLYNKLYNIDKLGHKKHLKKLKPIFQYKQNTMGGYKKHEIIRVAQENLFMLKRLNERTSFYNVEKWNKDYEASQYYKKNHCLYSPIDFNKTQRYGSYNKNWGLGAIQEQKYYTTRKKFFSKTHYSNTGIGDNPESRRISNSTKKRKRFEDFNYRDLLQLDEKNKNEDEKQFKKISDMENPEPEQQNEQEEKKMKIIIKAMKIKIIIMQNKRMKKNKKSKKMRKMKDKENKKIIIEMIKKKSKKNKKEKKTVIIM